MVLKRRIEDEEAASGCCIVVVGRAECGGWQVEICYQKFVSEVKRQKHLPTS